MNLLHSDIIRHIMVNLANCTKNLLYSRFIHIIHRLLTQNVEKLYTPFPVHFRGKCSYAPTYPHYPQSFSVYRQFSPSIIFHRVFCGFVLNFHISTKSTRFRLDKNYGSTIVPQRILLVLIKTFYKKLTIIVSTIMQLRLNYTNKSGIL